MNAITRGRPLLRTGISAAAVAGLVLLGTACSSNDSHQAAGGQTQSPYQAAVQYAQCMRANGDPSWPDPNSNGMFANNNGSLNESSAAYKTANKACSKYQTGNNAPNAAQMQQALATLLKYSRCMRAHGVKNYPDPTSDSTGVYISLSGVDKNSSQFQAAKQACSSQQAASGSQQAASGN